MAKKSVDLTTSDKKDVVEFMEKLKTSKELQAEFRDDMHKIRDKVERLWPKLDTLSDVERTETIALAEIVAKGLAILKETDTQ